MITVNCIMKDLFICYSKCVLVYVLEFIYKTLVKKVDCLKKKTYLNA